MRHKKTEKAAIILFWLIVWQAAAAGIDNRILMVGPVQVLYAFLQNLMQPDFIRTVLSSFVRIGLGFFLALFAGLLFGAAGYRFRIAREILKPVIQTLKSVPVASFVVLLLIWFGSGRLSFFISFLIVFPNVYVNTIAGLKSADAGLLEMAQVFGMRRRNRFFYIYRPALMPYLNSCLKISLGMCWKSGVAAEVIGLPDHSLGERLYMSKIYLDTAGLFAWTLTVILISFLFEKAVLWLVRLYGEWKPYPACGTFHSGSEGRKTLAGQEPSVGNEIQDGQEAERRKRQAIYLAQSLPSDQIEISHLSKAYGEQQILQDYSMTMEANRRYVLMAPSGAGKTSFLRILTGLDNADAGTIIGIPERVGMVFQEDRLCESYDAVCNIMLGGGSAEEAQVRREAAQILPEECLDKPVRELSGGMRRRVALLRAVLSDAGLLVLDEPFTGLDEESRERTAAYLLDHLGGRTLLVTTHREEDVKLLQGTKVILAFCESL